MTWHFDFQADVSLQIEKSMKIPPQGRRDIQQKSRALDHRYPAESWAEYFIGYVPAGMILSGNLEELRGLLGSIPSKSRKDDEPSQTLLELTVIAAVSFLEVFFRDHWASLVNIYPQSLASFEQRGRKVDISAVAMFDLDSNPLRQIGSMLSERFDFGTARAINGIFKDLIGITPIGKREMKELDKLCHDRNLLVHYGGVFRYQHKVPGFLRRASLRRRYADSLVVSRRDAERVLDLAERLAKKTMAASASALDTRLSQTKTVLSREKRKALEFLSVWL